MTSAPTGNGFPEHENEALRERIASLEARLADSAAQIEALRQSEARYRHLHRTRIDGFVRVTMEGRIEEANDLFCAMVGYTEDELRSLTYRDLTPSPWHASEDAIIREEVLPRGFSEPYEKEYRRKDGTVFPVEVRAFLVPGIGSQPPIGIAALVRDITSRKQGMQALRASEEEYRLLFEHMLAGLIVLDVIFDAAGAPVDYRFVTGNPAYERMTGHRVADDRGKTRSEWTIGWPPEVEQRFFRVAMTGVPVQYERFNQSLGRWYDTLAFSPRRGQFALVFTDITERKAVEAELERTREQLRGLSVRLINAQEAERARLAGELHDDFSQRLALLAVNLHLLRQALPAEATARDSVTDLYREVQALARDMRKTSHKLHPARLEQLGLVSALRGLCEDLAAAHGLAIRFEACDVVRDVPDAVALCLYRVAQEALGNVVKHSGATAAAVELTGTGSELRLAIIDAGRGFDVAAARGTKALGLVSIHERVLAIGGTFDLESEVGKGTRIEVRAPLEGETAGG